MFDPYDDDIPANHRPNKPAGEPKQPSPRRDDRPLTANGPLGDAVVPTPTPQPIIGGYEGRWTLDEEPTS